MRNTPVYLKNFVRLMRTAPAYMPYAIATATSTPTTSPTRGQTTFGLGVADHEQRGLDALAADGEERQRRHRDGARFPEP